MVSDLEAHVIDLLPEYVLNLLSREESSRVDRHLAGCPTCQAEYTHLQQIADDLPLALAQTAPPPALKNKLMKRIHDRTRPLAVAPQPTFWQRLAVFFRRSAPAWAAALIIVLVLGNLIQWNRQNQVAVNPTPAMQVIALANTADSPNAMGTLIMDQQGVYGTLVVDRLAMLAPSQEYQVWLIQDGQRTSAGLFSVNHDGYASLELWAPQPLSQYDAIGVTIEPKGGSPGPTGAKVLGATISSQ